MPKLRFRTLIGIVVVLGLAAFLVWAFRPQPVPVDLAQVERGALRITVADEGFTRVREIYTISAPVGGRLLRIDQDAGDPVVAGETVLANILPSDPALLDARSKSEAEAQVRSAEAALSFSRAEVERAEAEVAFARSELQRARELRSRGTISEAQLEKAELALRTAMAQLETAKAAVRVRAAELEIARARLIATSDESSDAADARNEGGVVRLIAPISGKVLRVLQESEAVVAPGAPIMDIGDPADLEVVVELLSTDAVRVREGARVLMSDWGGSGTLNGLVRRIEPFGFEKVSALGIEEQRVNVIIDLTDEPDLWAGLAHGFRVEADIVVWEKDDVLQVPASALFRQGGEWAVFRVGGDGILTIRTVTIGERNDRRAQILGGLEVGDRVVLHPSDRLSEGIRVVPREAGE